MALDFPNIPPPTEGQLYVGSNGITYVFTGGKWVGQGATGNVTTITDSLYSGNFIVNLDTTGNLNIPADGDVVRSGVAIFDAVAALQANSSGDDVAAANVQIGLLWTNAAAQATAINTINANVSAANAAVAALGANIGNLVTNAPAALDTLYEIANSLGNNASLSTTLMTAISGVRANVNAANVEIASTNANLTSFSTYANATFGTSSYGNANVKTYLTSFDGNLLPAANVTYSLGSSTRQWKDLWVSNNTIYIGNVPLTVSNGNLLVNGSLVTGSGSGTDDVLRANVGAYQTFANANAATQATSINTVNANIGAYQTFANSNAATQSTAIATLQTQVYANANVNTYLSSSIIGSLSTSGNLTVGGNLIVNGNSTIINTTSYTIEDNILQIADANPADTLDIGFVGHRTVGSVLQHTGLVRDASAGDWRLFSNVTAQPGATVDFTNAVYDDLVVGNISANIVKNGRTWAFGTGGNLTIPASGIITAPNAQEFRLQARAADSVLRNEIELDPNNGTYMSVWSEELSTSFSSGAGSWATGSWVNEGGFGAALFTNAEDLQDFWTTGIGSFVNSVEVSINGGARGLAYYDGNNGEQYGVALILDAVPVSSPTTITSLVFYYRTKNSIDIDYANGQLLLKAQSMNINLETTNYLNLRGQGANPVRIYTDDTTHKWEFDNTGSLTLPREGKIYGIGDGVAAGDRYGYISWAGNSSGDGSGYNTIRLVPDIQGLESADQYIIIDPTGGVPGHIHIRAGGTQDNSGADLYLGGENSHVKISAGLNPPVTVMANNRSWIFGNTGTTRFPDGTILAPVSQSITMQSDQYAQLMWQNANVTVAPDMAVMSNFYVAQNSATLDIVYRDGSSNQQQKSWLWSLDGGMSFPDTTTQYTAFSNAAVATYLANYDGGINFTASPAVITGLGNISSANFTFANGVNILSTVGANSYGNTQVAAYLTNYDGSINFTSSTAIISNVDVITVGAHIQSPAYQFSNGVSIFDGITGGGGTTYTDANVVAMLAANSSVFIGNTNNVNTYSLQANNTQMFIGGNAAIASGNAATTNSTSLLHNMYFAANGTRLVRNTGAGVGTLSFDPTGFTVSGLITVQTANSAPALPQWIKANVNGLFAPSGFTTSTITASGTVAVNATTGIQTSQTTFPLVNQTATTILFGGAATTINMGSATIGGSGSNVFVGNAIGTSSGNLTVRAFGTYNSVNSLNSSGGYGNTTYSNIAVTGGSGTGMIISMSGAASGYLASATVTNPGTGYRNGETITIPAGNPVGSLGGSFVIGNYNAAYLGQVLADYSFGIDGNLRLPGNVTIASVGSIRYANGVNYASTVTGTYSNVNVASYLTTATIVTTGNITAGNLTTTGTYTVASITTTGEYGNITGANVISANTISATNYLFANGVNILSTVSVGSTYSNVNVEAYIGGNIGAYQTYANANSATQATSIDTINANLGAYQTYANANVVAIQANLGAYQTYANATFSGGASTYSNTNVAAYLTTATITTTGNVTAANIITSGATSGNISGANYISANAFQVTNGIFWSNGTAWSSSSGGGTTYSNANVAAYLTAGNISVGTAGFTVLPNIVAQFTSNVNSYGQVNMQNINSGTDATTEIIATANNGTDTIFFVDMGIAGNTYDNSSPSNSLGTIIYANDAYLYAQGNTSANIGGNLAIGAATAGRSVTIFAGGINRSSNVATFANTGVTVYGNITATNIITTGTYGNITNANVISANNLVVTTTVRTIPVTFAVLPSAASAGAGARAFITDGNTATFGSQVGSGGANAIPVYSNGTNWYVG